MIYFTADMHFGHRANEKDITDIMGVLVPANVEKLIAEYPEISR